MSFADYDVSESAKAQAEIAAFYFDQPDVSEHTERDGWVDVEALRSLPCPSFTEDELDPPDADGAHARCESE